MIQLGFKVTSKFVFYSIYNEIEKTIKIDKYPLDEKIILPKKLNFFRNFLIELIKKEKIEYIGLKIAEKNALSINLERVAFEAIIQEVIVSENIENWNTFTLSEISKKLKIKSKEFKELISNDDNFNKFIYDKSEKIKTNTEYREAIILSIFK